ncbi:protein FAR-RED IMPAIRED RESPONSE 1-like [Chenopodium quinoa]|uniref:protein FAR-RED IMPAIRED RESPONSE 1-like n=1 Tax=Chenopodium quinoa TaxID=63459 RepID=UPI000B7926DB|nr:protein FAR-RED IMPAIRED RESPONSE 1-like [Chenopodium quinoa]
MLNRIRLCVNLLSGAEWGHPCVNLFNGWRYIVEGEFFLMEKTDIMEMETEGVIRGSEVGVGDCVNVIKFRSKVDMEEEEGNDMEGIEDIVVADSCAEGVGVGAVDMNVNVRYLSPVKTIHTTHIVVGSNEMRVIVEEHKEGMVFRSWHEVEAYYKEYAENMGFGVSRVQGVNSKMADKQRIANTWKCECWGKPYMRARREANKRAKAMGVGDSGGLVDGVVCEDELSRRKRTSKKCECEARVYAKVNEHGMWVVKTVHLEDNHKIDSANSKLVKEYRMKQMTSKVKKKLMDFYDQGVPISQINSCMATEQNGNMALTVKDLQHEVYKARRLKMVKWDSVAMMEVAYEDFGDAVFFDTTYLMNEYELPFANFVGVNYHGQSLLLGCALVSHEDCDTYQEFINPLKELVYESFDPEEFHIRWAEFIAEYKLEDNEWLQSLHKESCMWVPTYMKEFFWAGMKTTQRVESINRFFDGYVNRKTKLHEFPQKYCMALDQRVRDEVSADERCSKYLRRLKVLSENLIQYSVVDRVWIIPPGASEDVITDRRRTYNVTLFPITKEVQCDYRKFETSGILCKHCIRILDENLVKDLPEKYIVSRWRKDIPRKQTRVKVAYHDPGDTVIVKRFNKMMGKFEPLYETAAMVDDQMVHMVIDTLSKLQLAVNHHRDKKSQENVPVVSTLSSTGEDITISSDAEDGVGVEEDAGNGVEEDAGNGVEEDSGNGVEEEMVLREMVLRRM